MPPSRSPDMEDQDEILATQLAFIKRVVPKVAEKEVNAFLKSQTLGLVLASVNDAGELVLGLNNGKSINCGVVKGQDGATVIGKRGPRGQRGPRGLSVNTIDLNDNVLTVSLSDNTIREIPLPVVTKTIETRVEVPAPAVEPKVTVIKEEIQEDRLVFYIREMIQSLYGEWLDGNGLDSEKIKNIAIASLDQHKAAVDVQFTEFLDRMGSDHKSYLDEIELRVNDLPTPELMDEFHDKIMKLVEDAQDKIVSDLNNDLKNRMDVVISEFHSLNEFVDQREHAAAAVKEDYAKQVQALETATREIMSSTEEKVLTTVEQNIQKINDAIGSLSNNIAACAEDLVSFKSSIGDLIGEMAASGDDKVLTSLEENITQITTTINGLYRNIDSCAEEIVAFKSSMSESLDSMGEMVENVDTKVFTALDDHVMITNVAITKFNTSLAACGNELQDYKTEVDNCLREIADEMHKSNDSNDAIIAKVSTALGEHITTTNVAITHFNDDLVKCFTELQDYKTEVDNCLREIADEMSKSNDSNDAVITKACQSITALAEKISERSQELVDLKGYIDDTASEFVKLLAEENHSYEKKLSDFTLNHDNVSDALRLDVEAAITQAEQSIAQMKASLGDLIVAGFESTTADYKKTFEAYIDKSLDQIVPPLLDYKLSVEDGHLIVHHDNSKVNLGKVSGPEGPGVYDLAIDPISGNLLGYFVNNGKIDLKGLGRVVGDVGPEGKPGENGKAGEAGLGIKDGFIDDRGVLTLVLSDDHVLEVGKVIGPQGDIGVCITAARLDAQGELVLNFSDGTSTKVGKVTGRDGANGKRGEKGIPGIRGEKGDTGNSGAPAPGFLFRGKWQPRTYYSQDDNPSGPYAEVVIFEKSCFICTSSTILPPPNNGWVETYLPPMFTLPDATET